MRSATRWTSPPFTLADGRRITVKGGWRGMPEEQGFLRDVQVAACNQFNTVLAPGSNRLSLRPHSCGPDAPLQPAQGSTRQPAASPGEVVAAKAQRVDGMPGPSPT